jgi:hypothetical protein
MKKNGEKGEAPNPPKTPFLFLYTFKLGEGD